MKFLLILIIIAFSQLSFGKSFLVIKYSAKQGDSLKGIVQSFMRSSIPQSEANESLSTTMSKNPKVEKWNPFNKDTTFKLYMDPKVVDLKIYNKYYIDLKEREVHHFSVFTTPSAGYFSQANNNNFTIKYNQFSYFSLGMAYLYAPYKKPIQMTSSLYYSTLSSTSNKISSESNSVISIPGEYGGNIYASLPVDIQFTFHGGLDYESFSIFNLENIVSNDVVNIDAVDAFYVTLGVKYAPKYVENLFVKLSASKSLYTNIANSVPNSTKIKLDGIKFLLSFSYSINENWSANAIVKVHNFSGDNTLSVKRFGLGVGYTFF